MSKNQWKSQAEQILERFKEITGRKRFENSRTNLSGIERVLKEGFNEEEIIQIIQIKTLEWKNNPEMSVHLNPVTIFRPANFPKYINQLAAIKENPKLYAKYFAKINGRTFTGGSAADNADAINDLYG